MHNLTAPAMPEDARREAWLAARRQHITSTDLPAIMGIEGAYGAPVNIFLEKKNLLEKGEAPTHMQAGVRLQKPILEWYSDRRGVAIVHEDPYELTVHPEHPIIAASLDARWWDVVAGRAARVVDAKNVRYVDPEEWGEEGTDEVPARYIVQLHAQMECTGERDFADLAVLFSGAEPRWYTVPYNPEIAEGCVYAGERFWTDNVLRDIPPEVDSSEDWTKWLNSRVQKYANYIEATPEIVQSRRRALRAARIKKKLEEIENLEKNRVRAFIGEHAGMTLPLQPGQKKPQLVHYHRNKDGVEERTDDLLAELASRANVDLAEFRKPFTTSKPGARPLLLGKEK